jgi:hypothetical protein
LVNAAVLAKIWTRSFQMRRAIRWQIGLFATVLAPQVARRRPVELPVGLPVHKVAVAPSRAANEQVAGPVQQLLAVHLDRRMEAERAVQAVRGARTMGSALQWGIAGHVQSRIAIKIVRLPSVIARLKTAVQAATVQYRGTRNGKNSGAHHAPRHLATKMDGVIICE